MLAALFLVGLGVVCAQSSNDLLWTYFPVEARVGNQYTLKYEAKVEGSTATIYLRKGPIAELNYVQTLTNTSTGGQYEWAADKSLPPRDDYFLHLMQGTVSAFSSNIKITGGPDEQSSSSVSVTFTTSTPSASSIPLPTSTTPVLQPNPPEPQSGLSSTTKIATGIGVGLGAPLVAAIITIFYLLRKIRELRNRPPVIVYHEKPAPSNTFISELDAQASTPELSASEPYGGTHELHSPVVPPSKELRVEVNSV